MELYSQIEELFLDKEAAHFLWGEFIEILKNIDAKKVLDIGCGSGKFCKMAQEFNIKGIDISKEQVKKARKVGCDCEVKEIYEIKEQFDAAVAIFDVINYIPPNKIDSFFKAVKKITKNFIFDINTLFAMQDLAVGTLKAEDKDKFSILHSDFEDNRLITQITLFKKENNCYKRFDEKIIQYYHPPLNFQKYGQLNIYPISLYGSKEPEKFIIHLSF